MRPENDPVAGMDQRVNEGRTVLVENGEHYASLMDEPEISLHIEWQKQLINIIRELNPNAQIILSTHSPALIMDGWMDIVTEVEDVLV